MNNKIKLLEDIKTSINKELISLKKLLKFYRDCYKDAKQSGDFHTVIMSAYIIFSLYDNIKSLQDSYKDTCDELVEEYTQEFTSIQDKETNLYKEYTEEAKKLLNLKEEINRKIVLIRREVSKCTEDLKE